MTQLIKINPRVLQKYSNEEGVVPTIPLSNNHLDGTWLDTDIHNREFFVNTVDKKVYIRLDDEIIDITETTVTETFFVKIVKIGDYEFEAFITPELSGATFSWFTESGGFFSTHTIDGSNSGKTVELLPGEEDIYYMTLLKCLVTINGVYFVASFLFTEYKEKG